MGHMKEMHDQEINSQKQKLNLLVDLETTAVPNHNLLALS